MRARNIVKFLFALCAAALLSACTTSGERTRIKVGFYDVRGESFEELDRQISLHGPRVDGVGKAIAATGIRMLPEIRTRISNGECSVASIRVRVKADVTLPRRRGATSRNADVNRAFNNLQEYAKLHEAVHVTIADRYAAEAEKRISRLPARKSCRQLYKDIGTAFAEVMDEHRRAQLEFDIQENKRIAAIAAKK
jgi:predicted secreted Zn-dependent protease